MRPDEVLKRLAWRGVLSIGSPMEQWTTWTMTGAAAMVALFISNLDSANEIISLQGIRWCLLLLAFALLFGGLSKQLGMAVQGGLTAARDLESLLNTEDGQSLIEHVQAEPKELIQGIARPFLWPMSAIMRRAGERGVDDHLDGDKRLVFLFCLQWYASNIHVILIAASIVVLALSIHG